MSQPLSIPKLSSLSTSTLSSILELTRAHQLHLPSPQLSQTVARNIATINNSITLLHEQGESSPAFTALEAQYDRLIELVIPLGVEVPPKRNQGRTARLVDTGEEEELDDGDQ